MAKTKQTARKTTGGLPRQSHATKVTKNKIIIEKDTLDLNKLTVIQLKDKQKELGIDDSSIKGTGSKGNIIKNDRIKAIENFMIEKQPLEKVDTKSKKQSSTDDTKFNKKTKDLTVNKETYILFIWSRDDYMNREPRKICEDPTEIFVSQSLDNIKNSLIRYIRKNRELDDILDDDYEKDAIQYTLDEFKSLEKGNVQASPELNSVYAMNLYKSKLI